MENLSTLSTKSILEALKKKNGPTEVQNIVHELEDLQDNTVFCPVGFDSYDSHGQFLTRAKN